ncbi:hypothetical protein CAL22_17985 [Bordetella genomosp. 12]|uniref:Uncharacterized protein n=1 Tax=Bordetella genomosp. 12 TaxID=463035 RepID=A0A261VC04_9BORD|nr:hypothetical protein CAL22_17985 [Bordetella genomosp. 12]
MEESGLTWSKQAANPAVLSGAGLIHEMLTVDGVFALRLGRTGLAYIDGSNTYLIAEQPRSVRVLDAYTVIERMGKDLAEEHEARFIELEQGYECAIGEVTSLGRTRGEAAIRAWLFHHASQPRGKR